MFETIFPRTTTSSTNRNQNQGGLFTLLSSNPVLTGSTQSVIICDHFHLRTLPYSHLKTGVFSNNMTPLVARDIPVSWAWLQIFPQDSVCLLGSSIARAASLDTAACQLAFFRTVFSVVPVWRLLFQEPPARHSLKQCFNILTRVLI